MAVMQHKRQENLVNYENTADKGEAICIEDYAYLVKRIAHHMMARMPASVQVEDLIQAGMLGLLEAAQKYDAARGASFETYAGIRIRGSIVDEMRRGDWAPRSVHRNTRRVTETINILEAKLGRDASDTEIAEAMGVELDEYYSILRDTASARLFSYEETVSDDDNRAKSTPLSTAFLGPVESVENQALKQALVDAITKLSEREQLVLSLYYDEELNLKEIGRVIGVSESRISQIHSQAAMRLRARLGDWQSDE